jgi:hypothetical protein
MLLAVQLRRSERCFRDRVATRAATCWPRLVGSRSSTHSIRDVCAPGPSAGPASAPKPAGCYGELVLTLEAPTMAKAAATSNTTDPSTGYCMKCKATREIKSAKPITMKNGRPATEGTCAVCSTRMFKIGAGK